jgi:hypothetical protein
VPYPSDLHHSRKAILILAVSVPDGCSAPTIKSVEMVAHRRRVWLIGVLCLHVLFGEALTSDRSKVGRRSMRMGGTRSLIWHE